MAGADGGNRDNRGIFEIFYHDNRAVEGLVVRLFVAMVVGLGALSVMTGILTGLPVFTQTEVTVVVGDGAPATVDNARSNMSERSLHVVTQDGEPVKGAQVVIKGKDVELVGGPQVRQTGPDTNAVYLDISDESSGKSADIKTDLRSDQKQGELKVTVQPPSDSDYVDRQRNPTLTVIG